MNRDHLNDLVKLAQKEKYTGLFYLSRAIDGWDGKPGEKSEVVSAQAFHPLVDVLDLLDRLPNLLGFESEDEMVVGYKVTTTGAAALSPEAQKELQNWNWLRTKAFLLADMEDRPDPMPLRGPLTELVERLSDFVASRARIAANLKYAREHRGKS